MDRLKDGRMDGWVNGQKDGQMGAWMDNWRMDKLNLLQKNENEARAKTDNILELFLSNQSGEETVYMSQHPWSYSRVHCKLLTSKIHKSEPPF